MLVKSKDNFNIFTSMSSIFDFMAIETHAKTILPLHLERSTQKRYGAQHACRAAALIRVFVNFYQGMNSLEALNLTEREVKILQIVALFHDVSSKNVGAESCEELNAKKCERYLLRNEVEEAKKYASIIVNKEKSDIFSKIFQSAYYLETVRCQDEFHVDKMSIYFDAKQQENETALLRLIKEVIELMAKQNDINSDVNVIENGVFRFQVKKIASSQGSKPVYEYDDYCYEKVVADFVRFKELSYYFHEGRHFKVNSVAIKNTLLNTVIAPKKVSNPRKDKIQVASTQKKTNKQSEPAKKSVNDYEVAICPPERGDNLLAAIGNNDSEKAKCMIRSGVNLNMQNDKGETALHLAVNLTRQDVFLMLIHAGVDLNMETNKGNTALHLTVKYGHSTKALMLIEAGADPSVKNAKGYTALHLFVDRSIDKLVQLWIAAQERLSEWKNISEAEKKKMIEAFKHNYYRNIVNFFIRFLATGVDLNQNEVINLAKQKNNLFIASALQEATDTYSTRNILQDPRSCTLYLYNPMEERERMLLFNAIYFNDLELVKKSIQSGMNLNLQDDRGSTALHIAVYYEKPSIVNMLIEAKVLVNVLDIQRNTVLHYAINGNVVNLRLLINAGADINHQNVMGDTALTTAILRNKVDAFQVILAAKPNLNLKNNFGYTALHLAVTIANVEMVRALLEEKADISLKTPQGNTAFQLAAEKNEIIQLFIDAEKNNHSQIVNRVQDTLSQSRDRIESSPPLSPRMIPLQMTQSSFPSTVREQNNNELNKETSEWESLINEFGNEVEDDIFADLASPSNSAFWAPSQARQNPKRYYDDAFEGEEENAFNKRTKRK